MSVKNISERFIQQKIFFIRGAKVMFDRDLAELYQVSTKTLIQAVKRNRKRFPKDFMFQITVKELENLRSQFVTSSWGGRRYLPYVFSEQGVAMLSSVLKSDKAVFVNIAIMRVFVKIREILSTNKELADKLKELSCRVDSHDEQIQAILEAIRQLIKEDETPKRGIGFHVKYD